MIKEISNYIPKLDKQPVKFKPLAATKLQGIIQQLIIKKEVDR